MVCNNLAARGLDLPNTQHVIQFDYAKTPADYLHRVGRVGRLGQTGRVTNLIRKGDQQLSAYLTSSDLDELIFNNKRK